MSRDLALASTGVVQLLQYLVVVLVLAAINIYLFSLPMMHRV